MKKQKSQMTPSFPGNPPGIHGPGTSPGILTGFASSKSQAGVHQGRTIHAGFPIRRLRFKISGHQQTNALVWTSQKNILEEENLRVKKQKSQMFGVWTPSYRLSQEIPQGSMEPRPLSYRQPTGLAGSSFGRTFSGRRSYQFGSCGSGKIQSDLRQAVQSDFSFASRYLMHGKQVRQAHPETIPRHPEKVSSNVRDGEFLIAVRAGCEMVSLKGPGRKCLANN